MCESTRKIDRHEFRCNRVASSHKIHHARVLDEDDKIVQLEWDDRDSWSSQITRGHLHAEREGRRYRSLNG